jgi:hypothetical protein
MNIEAVLEQLAGWCEDDWIGLWLVVAHVAEDLSIEDPDEQLKVTLVLVRELLKRGVLAGDSPARSARFVPWPDQDPDAVAAFIQQEWLRNDEYPSWGDGPWFAAPRFRVLDA